MVGVVGGAFELVASAEGLLLRNLLEFEHCVLFSECGLPFISLCLFVLCNVRRSKRRAGDTFLRSF